MKLYEIWNESLDSLLPVQQVRPGRYRITIDQHVVDVLTHSATIDGLLCGSVMIIDPRNIKDPTAAQNVFNTTQAFQIFSTIIKIVEQQLYDYVFMIPDDTSFEIEQQKGSVYKAILIKLQRLNRLYGWEEITLPEYNKPILCGVCSSKAAMNVANVEDIAKKFGRAKFHI